MVKKAAHPDFRLFEYLNGNIDETAAQQIEKHLVTCDDCASVARLVRGLKDTVAVKTLGSQPQNSNPPPSEHPDLSELASFFYAKSRRPTASKVAAHVAHCGSCCEAIAQYALSERAAAEYEPANAPAQAVPGQAWEMIRDWEDSSFAKVKPADEVLGQELLTRLTHFLGEQQYRTLDRSASATHHAERVPVLIVSRSGEVRSVEFFDREFDSTGASVLRHSEGSERFDNKPLLALFGFGGKESLVVSNPVQRDTIRVERVRSDQEPLRADFIIIED